jgi:hypothetical protein
VRHVHGNPVKLHNRRGEMRRGEMRIGEDALDSWIMIKLITGVVHATHLMHRVESCLQCHIGHGLLGETEVEVVPESTH